MKSQTWSRRQALKGAGMMLAVPWLETFAPRTARAQAAATRKRYISIYQPNGTAAYWMPTGAGSGAGWTLSPLLQPLQDHKTRMMVFANIANSAPFGGETYTNNIGLGSHGADCASTWTGAKPAGPGNANNGISIDQVVAQMYAADPANKTYLSGLQLGLSTKDAFGDGIPNQHSRSISWKSASEPMYKVVNPQAVFDQLMAGRPAGGTNTNPTPDPLAERRRLLKKSSLDYIIESSTTLQTRLSRSDKVRVDQFLSSVRTIEARVAKMMPTMPLPAGACPAMPARAANPVSVGMQPTGYDRGEHANVMIDLLTLAIQCDITRSVSFMLDDARSEFSYQFLKTRNFTATGSTDNPTGGPVGEYHGLQHAGERTNNTNAGFATIGWWNSVKTAQIATKLAAVTEGASGTILDNTVIVFASGMHGGDHLNNNLPVAILGGKGTLKQDTFVPGAKELQLADVLFTILKQFFGYPGAAFGVGKTLVPEILV
jgi:hypothetical protein